MKKQIYMVTNQEGQCVKAFESRLDAIDWLNELLETHKEVAGGFYIKVEELTCVTKQNIAIDEIDESEDDCYVVVCF